MSRLEWGLRLINMSDADLEAFANELSVRYMERPTEPTRLAYIAFLDERNRRHVPVKFYDSNP